jgi:hypothetical protein
MRWPHATLTDQQARETFFVVPETAELYMLALGKDGYRQFKDQRARIRTLGGELLLIGWPDGTTITYSVMRRGDPIDAENVLQIYRASAALHRISSKG